MSRLYFPQFFTQFYVVSLRAMNVWIITLSLSSFHLLAYNNSLMHISISKSHKNQFSLFIITLHLFFSIEIIKNHRNTISANVILASTMRKEILELNNTEKNNENNSARQIRKKFQEYSKWPIYINKYAKH